MLPSTLHSDVKALVASYHLHIMLYSIQKGYKPTIPFNETR